MGRIGIISDDLTGGTTVGVLMARSNIETAVYFSPEDLTDSDNQDALILTSDSRALSKLEATNSVARCFEALEEHGATNFSKRIDTTLRGGIGYEIDEMLAHMPEDTIAVMVPGMPQSNRIVVGGYSVIDGKALSKTDVAKDVLTPVTESHVPTMILKQSKYKVGQVDLASILAGKETLKDVLRGKKAEGCKIIICDAINMDEITEIAEVVVELNWNVLAVDPGPFTQELALARGVGNKKEEVVMTKEKYTLSVEDKVLVVAGSATENTKNQLNELNKNSEVRMVSADPLKLIDSSEADNEIDRVYNVLRDILSDNSVKVAIVETAVSRPVVNLSDVEDEFDIERGAASRNINVGLGKIVESALEDIENINGIYLTGGDTMVTTLKTLGAKGIKLIDYVIPQTDLGRIIGGRFNDLITIGKGGLTGNLYTAVHAVNKINEEHKSEIKVS